MKRAVVMLLTTASLAGCAVGPNYARPSPPGTNAGAFAEASPALTAAAPADARWWRLYNDPAMDGFVRQALAQNTDLQVAVANLAEARGLLNQARAGLFPSTGLTAGDTYGRSAIQDFLAGQNGQKAQNTWAYSAGLDVSYEVDLFGRVRRSVEAAKANTAAAQAAVDAVRVTVFGLIFTPIFYVICRSLSDRLPKPKAKPAHAAPEAGA